jgi:murein DD-endopeptidase MepM/ murein hydrolase activator NlpD
MSRPAVPLRLRAALHFCPGAAVLALVAIAAAGCSDSARFESYNRQTPPRDVTGSIGRVPEQRVETRTLPAPSRPATVTSRSVSYGAHGLGAYRPATRGSDVTGSVVQRPAAAGHWTWDGGSPVTVGRGETIESVARHYGVPVSAILEANGFREGAVIRSGQRLVIPRYVPAREPSRAAAAAPAARPDDIIHTVAPGETLMRIAHHYSVELSTLARANKIQPYSKIEIGQRLTIPGGRRVAALREPAPKAAPPRTVAPAESVGSVPVENARIAMPEPQPHQQSAVKTAEAAGSLPSFRWPVKGRIITAFGAKVNGAQNDGINLAVPEGTPIKAADDGVVAYAGNELKGYGNLVLVRHANGYVSAYANASQLLVKRGETVKRGQVIARAGQTGNVSSPQLHFEIRKGSTPVDPLQFLGGA